MGFSFHDGPGGQFKLTIGPDGIGYKAGVGLGAGTPEASLTVGDKLPEDAQGVDAKLSAKAGEFGGSIGGEAGCTDAGSCSLTGNASGTLAGAKLSDSVKTTCTSSGCSTPTNEVTVGTDLPGVPNVSQQIGGDGKTEVSGPLGSENTAGQSNQGGPSTRRSARLAMSTTRSATRSPGARSAPESGRCSV